MKILKKLLELSRLEKYDFDSRIDFVFHEQIIFDEIPLISHLEHEVMLKKAIAPEMFNPFLLNTAIFYANHLKMKALQELSAQEFKKYMICITYPDIADKDTVFDFNIPHLCIIQSIHEDHFRQYSDLEIAQAPWLFDALAQLNLGSSFLIKTHTFNDQDSTNTRYYLLSKI